MMPRNTIGAPGDEQGQRAAGLVEELGHRDEAGEHEDREHHEPGEPLEHHGGERVGGVPDVGRRPADPEDVAPDVEGRRFPTNWPAR